MWPRSDGIIVIRTGGTGMACSMGEDLSRPNNDETVEYKPETTAATPQPRSGDSTIPEFPGYILEGELGRGGLGVVYRGRDVTLNRPVAIKVLTTAEGSQKQRQKVIEEARRAAALGDRCIVTIYGVIEHQGNSAIVMELVENGETLKQYCQPDNLLPLE